ncbi:MAG: HDOD domain-containing protein [Halothiobacillaceae bacterium]|nr:HDOD domain-containing protein [Halothiobacillaceae bacterium]
MPLPEHWIEQLSSSPLPVQRDTLEALRNFLDADTDIPIAQLTALVRSDPGLTAFIMGHASRLQDKKGRDAPHNIEHALTLLGRSFLGQHLSELRAIEDSLPEGPQRLGYLAALGRALHTAAQLQAWAIARNNLMYESLYVAGLLNNYIELALWRDAPEMMYAAFHQMTEADTSLGHALMLVLKEHDIDLGELEDRLNRYWYLPMQLFRDEKALPHMVESQQYALLLARRLACESEHGWYHPRMLELKKRVAEYLSVGVDQATRLIHKTAIELAPALLLRGIWACAALLPSASDAAWPLAPWYRGPLRVGPGSEAIVAGFENRLREIPHTSSQVLQALLHTLAEALELKRLLLLTLNGPRDALVVRYISGFEADSPLRKVEVPLAGNHLFAVLIRKNQGIWLHPGNLPQFAPHLPLCARPLAQAGSAYVHALCIGDVPLGILYAAHARGSVLDKEGFTLFARIVRLALNAMADHHGV